MTKELSTQLQSTEHKPDLTIKSGKTTYLLNLQFGNKGKQTMNDKVFKLILNDYARKTNSMH